MLPLFLNLTGRRVVLVGDGPVAAAKRELLLAAGADVLDVPAASFEPRQLDDAWLVVTAADASVNAAVARAAEERRVFVNAADDPANASAYLSGVVRRGGVTIAISTEGSAPGLTGLLRQALDDVLPDEVGEWVDEAKRQRAGWRRDGVPFESRRPLLLDALNRRYGRSEDSKHPEDSGAKGLTSGPGAQRA